VRLAGLNRPHLASSSFRKYALKSDVASLVLSKMGSETCEGNAFLSFEPSGTSSSLEWRKFGYVDCHSYAKIEARSYRSIVFLFVMMEFKSISVTRSVEELEVQTRGSPYGISRRDGPTRCLWGIILLVGRL
jgi:hypothetical protein